MGPARSYELQSNLLVSSALVPAPSFLHTKKISGKDGEGGQVAEEQLCVGCVTEACPYPRGHLSSFPFLMPTDARTRICLPMLVLQRRCGRMARRWACISPPRPTQVKGASRAGEKQEVIKSTLTQRVQTLGKRELRGSTLAPAVHAPSRMVAAPVHSMFLAQYQQRPIWMASDPACRPVLRYQGELPATLPCQTRKS